MGMMIDGVWSTEAQLTFEKGAFARQASVLRDWVAPADVAPGRYRLYVHRGCPWANRAWMTLKLLGLEAAIELVVADDDPSPSQGWLLREDPEGRAALHEVYRDGADRYTGRATVPVLVDKSTGRIVNNESSEIIRMFAQTFAPLHTKSRDLYPLGLREEIDAVNERVYAGLNNGVYRAGFAQEQAAHDAAAADVFATLDWLDARLGDGRPFLMGDELTEADVRLLPTLMRFQAYREVFYCDLEPESRHPHVWAYRERARAIPEVAAVTLPAHVYVAGYGSIPFVAVHNPGIEKRWRKGAA